MDRPATRFVPIRTGEHVGHAHGHGYESINLSADLSKLTEEERWRLKI